ncbi:MAG: hypothetical protein FWC65_00790, partial [Treponema sp.]|nr:hypothetical protein [Treponema sp.]
MLKVIVLIITLAALFSGCAGSAPAARNDAAREAEDAARAALAAMDGGGTTAPVAAAPAGAPAAPRSGHGAGFAGGARPAWVDNPEMVYARTRYISVVGYGSDRNLAERDALARLTGVFGQAVQAELHTVVSYSEAIRGGVIQVSEDTQVRNAIITSAQMDTLVGAEIADNWHAAQNNVSFAVAIMERERTSVLYADLIRSNERIIGDLVNMTAQVRNSLDGVARYRLAAVIADANRVYANVLTVVGNTRGINPAEMTRGDDFRVAAAEVVAAIPIGVVVTGDRGNRIHNAFAAAVTRAGFRSGAAEFRYVLQVSYNVNPVDLPGQPNQFVRYELIAALVDTAGGNASLFAHPAMVGREGHLTMSEAEERAFRAAER